MFGQNRPMVHTSLPSLSTIDSVDSRDYHDQVTLNRPNTAHLIPSRSPSLKKGDSDQTMVYQQYSEPPPASSYASVQPSRPQLARVPSVQTRYMEMLLHLDRIPSLHNVLASLFTWILLAGFLVVPGTFTSFKNSDVFKNADEDDSNKIAHAIVHSIANIGLLWLAGTFCLIGGLGCFWLWWRWRANYVWLINKIFLPALLNSVAGLLTTIVNVYTAQKGVWSVIAKITAILTSSCIGVVGALFCMYNFWVLQKVRESHERELRTEEAEKSGKRESIVDKVKRKANELSLQPGSVA